MLRIGIIGCGGMGNTHTNAYKAVAENHDVAVVALADGRTEFLDKAKTIWPEADTYADGLDLLDKAKVDAVSICLPSYLHTEHAVRAMEKGIAVLIEKPVCITEEDCKTLREAQKATKTPAMVGQVLRFFPEYRYLETCCDEKPYGSLQDIEMHRTGGDVRWGFEDWFHDTKKSGSVMLDLHVHDVDFLLHLLGHPTSMHVKTETFPSGMVNHVTASYRFGPVKALAEGLWDRSPDRPFEATFTARFEHAVLAFNSREQPSLRITADGGIVSYPLGEKKTNPYAEEIAYFVTCLEQGNQIEKATLQDGIAAVRLVLEEQELMEIQH